ncbi:hypothetical protein P153DRAFT_365472 [Dothidotthia symphoricarpi CBS 119687]|uniref:Uncharacterized protein n=1 Tax=Dothidotthia symphoricarpi CBS 119687 TaxID=1392245 RepID=A0A6A6AIB5_9PLEO|nr:uncharacterized protein P153DRAFT_365472 [Dothidotthia symphoricarpi CBS 119687]KAF2130828.1 hypothetical protein P153DRAFT_365472 [Dothidotthia symphoricarpi CBS 119687]
MSYCDWAAVEVVNSQSSRWLASILFIGVSLVGSFIQAFGNAQLNMIERWLYE